MHLPSIWLMHLFLLYSGLRDLSNITVLHWPGPCGMWLQRPRPSVLTRHKHQNSVACSVQFLGWSDQVWSTDVSQTHHLTRSLARHRSGVYGVCPEHAGLLKSLVVLPVARWEPVTRFCCCPEQPCGGMLPIYSSSHHISTDFHSLAALTVCLKGRNGIIRRGESIISSPLRYFSKSHPESFSEYCLVRPHLS